MKYGFAILATLVPAWAVAADGGCRTNPKLIGECRTAQGMVLMSADIGLVFAEDGTERQTLIVRAAPDSERDVPKAVEEALASNLLANIHGSYVICPIPTQPSQFPPEQTRFVCIDSVANLRIGQGQ